MLQDFAMANARDVEPVAKEEALSKCLVFQALEAYARAELASFAVTRSHKAGEPIFGAGTEVTCFQKAGSF